MNKWIFLNSSVSEGLPLAMGEAALMGVPVVCTDVGASFRVVTDPRGSRFSEVVAPNDAESLARAQIKVLALLDKWSAFADDAPGESHKLPLHPTREDVQRITRRMYDKTEQRRRLGLKARDNVLSSFSSDRYLREHEQMLWIGRYQSISYQSRAQVAILTSDMAWIQEASGPSSCARTSIANQQNAHTSAWSRLQSGHSSTVQLNGSGFSSGAQTPTTHSSWMKNPSRQSSWMQNPPRNNSWIKHASGNSSCVQMVEVRASTSKQGAASPISTLHTPPPG
jgi:hypothetical protein